MPISLQGESLAYQWFKYWDTWFVLALELLEIKMLNLKNQFQGSLEKSLKIENLHGKST